MELIRAYHETFLETDDLPAPVLKALGRPFSTLGFPFKVCFISSSKIRYGEYLLFILLLLLLLLLILSGQLSIT